MPTATINPAVNLINLNNHFIPPIDEEEDFYDPTPEEEVAIAEAEAEHARGEYYVMRDDETAEEFFLRISSDPEKWLACNTGEWAPKN